MDTAHQALDLLRIKMTAADLAKLNPNELRQFREICHHWAALSTPKKPSNTAA